jgi:hypothetical protein
MPPLMPQLRATFTLLVLLGTAASQLGCGDEIGDECSLSTDCSSQGDRICDISSPNGYCTIIGCDHDTCPEESICVRFFSVSSSNRACDPRLEDVDPEQNMCTADEFCTLSGTCVPRTAEIRYCMKTCGGNGDCRDGYECRDEELMQEHGGEPVPPPGEAVSQDPQPFCAAAPLE